MGKTEAAGVLYIADNLTVTLTGSGADLSIKAEAGVKLTLDGVSLTGAKTLLEISGGSLTLLGENLLTNNSDEKDNTQPTIAGSGDFKLGGTGSLYVSAGVGNSCIKLTENSVFTQEGGTLLISKDGLLGGEGGAFHAPGAQVLLIGGVFAGDTNSDNVSVIYAENIKITGGILCGYPKCVQRGIFYRHFRKNLCTRITYDAGGINSYWRAGSYLAFTCSDGIYDKSFPDYNDISKCRYYMDDTAQEEVPAGLAITWESGSLEESTFSQIAQSATDSGNLRFVYGVSQETFLNKNAAGARSPHGVLEVTLIYEAPFISPGSVGTEDDITREQMITIVYRYAQYKEYDVSQTDNLSGFSDNDDVSDWAQSAMAWAAASGIIKGSDGMLSPQDTATRAQVAAILQRFLEKYE